MFKQIFNKKNNQIPADKSKLEKLFADYLAEEKKLSSTTIKNYLVDISHFIGYLKSQNKQKNLKIDHSKIENYKSYLLSSDLAESTVKRRLSTVRAFCQMGVKKGWFKANFAKDVSNPSSTTEAEKILAEFENWLKTEGLTSNTTRNYVADVRNYLLNAE